METYPICNKNPILPPNGVCRICYNKMYRQIIPSKEKMLQNCKRRNPNFTPEEIEKHVQSNIDCCYNIWQSMAKNGLSAVTMATEIVDEAEHLPTEKVWHCKRVNFVVKVIQMLPITCFAPATRQQLNSYSEKAIEYWQGNMPKEILAKYYTDMKQLIAKITPPYEWSEKSLPLWILMEEENFDWMWGQFLECVHDCISPENNLSPTQWMELYHTYFGDILEAWVQKNIVE